MRFCDIDQIGLVCDNLTLTTERRRDDEVTVVQLVLALDPLTPALAAAIDPVVRKLLFQAGHPDPAPQLRDVTFALGVPRQLLTIFATRDSSAGIAFDQVKIVRVKATRRGVDEPRWRLTVKVSFGPCSPAELAYVQAWFGTQRFVTFTPSQTQLDFAAAAPADAADEPPAEPASAGILMPDLPRGKRRTTH